MTSDKVLDTPVGKNKKQPLSDAPKVSAGKLGYIFMSHTCTHTHKCMCTYRIFICLRRPTVFVCAFACVCVKWSLTPSGEQFDGNVALECRNGCKLGGVNLIKPGHRFAIAPIPWEVAQGVSSRMNISAMLESRCYELILTVEITIKLNYEMYNCWDGQELSFKVKCLWFSTSLYISLALC